MISPFITSKGPSCNNQKSETVSEGKNSESIWDVLEYGLGEFLLELSRKKTFLQNQKAHGKRRPHIVELF